MGPRAGIALAVLAASTITGCGHSTYDDGLLGDARAVVEQVTSAPLATIEDGHVVRASSAAVVVAPSGGFIVEPHRQRAYHLDTGDRLRIFVYGQPNLSRLYIVDQSGIVSVPLIGSIRARGLTTTQLEGAIRSRLGQQLVRDPQVTVDVQQNRPFFILGEVRSAGQYPYVTGMTVETAVAIAGGYGDRASERRARVTRKVNGVTDIFEVTPDMEIEPGDTVYVYERFL